MSHKPRNSFIAPGITRLSRSSVFAKRALYKKQKVAAAKPEASAQSTKTVQVNGDKNGKERIVALNKASRWYPAEDVAQPKASRKTAKPTKIRASITPGTVLVLLAGRFRGKRVVFLKQLASGLLLVTGPYKVNGVPLRRVNQAYVIATSTKVDLSSVKVDDKFDDAYFKKEKTAKSTKTEEEFFDEKQTKKTVSETRSADQKVVDKEILAAVAQVPHLRTYLNASFTLRKGQAPHAMKF
ncbi:60S ribosomal protein L6 [Basidiobolus ranarum]|uniref:60S ribosomal protein L6 n=1 Tax=Basidiobolus ranarum TaxID=34480 RepID=A0ABR2WFU9_9FUNG